MKKNIFLNYTRSGRLTNDLLNSIKRRSKDNLYCDLFDNYFNNVNLGNMRSFSNDAIGYLFMNLEKAECLVHLQDKNDDITNAFTLTEILLCLYYNKPLYNLEIDSVLENDNLLDYINIIFKSHKTDDSILYRNLINELNKNSLDKTFISYTREQNPKIINLLFYLKAMCGNDVYVDYFDNNILKEDKQSYHAFNKDCRFSPEIFKEVFNQLVKCNRFCIVLSDQIFNNSFVKMQYQIAKALGKDIYVIEEEKLKDIENVEDLDKYKGKANIQNLDKEFNKKNEWYENLVLCNERNR